MEDRDQFTLQWLDALDLPSELCHRSNQQHIPLPAPAQALAAQHQIKRLLPGHVFQAQGNPSLHRVADHQVDARVIGHDLKHRTQLDVLEVERHRLTLKRLGLRRLKPQDQ